MVDFLQVLAEIIGAILNFLKPIVSPIGAWMINWIEVVLRVFPKNDLALYIILFVIIIIIGAITNILWPGDKPPRFFEKKYKLIELEKEPESVGYEDLFKKERTIEFKKFGEEFKEPGKDYKESADEYEDF
ncbi:MAG: hypothetical protein ACFE8M_00020 [Candidatus Hermodarchaeota archaeon]